MTIRKARISWTATSLGTSFAQYEIERNDDTTGYQRIANITTEATTHFDDYESLRNENVQYRMRVRRTDGSVSAYTTPSSGVNVFDTACTMIFVSNELAPSNYIEANDEAPRKYNFPERSQTVEMHGRDNAVTFKATENEGDDLTVRLLLYGNFDDSDGSVSAVTAALQGRQAFEAIRALSRANCSYVCVLDSDGNRWYASITVTPGERDAGSGRDWYFATVHIRETASIPSTPATSPS